MKVRSILDKLSKAATVIEKITEKNPSLPVLECILIEAKKNQLLLRSTNLHTGIEIKVTSKVEKEGVVAVKGAILSRVLQSLGGDSNVDLFVDGNSLNINNKHSSIKIKTQDHGDFPTLPKNESDNVFHIDAEKFLEGLRSVAYSAATTEIKPEISSVCVYPEGNSLVFVATDSFRLAEKRIKIDSVENFPGIIVPIKNVREIIRIFTDITNGVEVRVGESQISFSNQDFYFISRIIEGNFPDYKQIIPPDFTTEAVFLKKDIGDAFRVIEPFSDDYNQITLSLDTKKEKCILLAKNSNTGESNIDVDVKLTGENVDIKFNYLYFTESLQSIGGDSLVFKIQQGKPIVIKPVHDESFLALIMPINR